MFTSTGERHTRDHLIVTNDQTGRKKKQKNIRHRLGGFTNIILSTAVQSFRIQNEEISQYLELSRRWNPANAETYE